MEFFYFYVGGQIHLRVINFPEAAHHKENKQLNHHFHYRFLEGVVTVADLHDPHGGDTVYMTSLCVQMRHPHNKE